MDWANERYVRLYTRDSTTWKLLDWKARALLPLLMRKLNRAGVLDVGSDGVLGVAAQVEMPIDIVEDGMRQLLARGVLVMTATTVVMPNFLEAQEAVQTTNHRSREYRARQRDAALLGVTTGDAALPGVAPRDGSITKRDASVTKRDATVTPRHTASLLSDPSQEEEDTSGKPDDPALAFAQKAIALINTHAGTKYRPTSEAVLKLCRTLIRNKHTLAEAERVIASKRAWVDDPKMGQYFRPATLLAAKNFATYLDDLEASREPRQLMATVDDDEPDLTYSLFAGVSA